MEIRKYPAIYQCSITVVWYEAAAFALRCWAFSLSPILGKLFQKKMHLCFHSLNFIFSYPCISLACMQHGRANGVPGCHHPPGGQSASSSRWCRPPTSRRSPSHRGPCCWQGLSANHFSANELICCLLKNFCCFSLVTLCSACVII